MSTIAQDVESQKKKSRAALLSVGSNTLLVVLKLGVGFFIGSVSVISEAIHSGMDLVAALIAYFSVRTSSKPADKKHPYGHGKIENVSGTVEALLIFVAAMWIIYEAIQKFAHPEPLDAPLLGASVMLVSSLVNVVVSQVLFKVGRQTDSIALVADAWHLRTDVYTSAGVMGGLGLIWVGGWILPETNLQWLDPTCALAVALLIIKAAYDLTRQSASDLLDVSLPEDEEIYVRNLLKSYPGVIFGFHDLRSRKAGQFRFVEVHIQVEPQMTVAESHGLTRAICSLIESKLPHSTVTIHVEPCTKQCSDKCLSGCLVQKNVG